MNGDNSLKANITRNNNNINTSMIDLNRVSETIDTTSVSHSIKVMSKSGESNKVASNCIFSNDEVSREQEYKKELGRRLHRIKRRLFLEMVTTPSHFLHTTSAPARMNCESS